MSALPRPMLSASLLLALGAAAGMPAQAPPAAVPGFDLVQAGMDADIAVIDPANVRDRATPDRSAQASEGIRHLVVNGTLLIEDGTLDASAKPGRPVRRSVGAD